MLARVRADADAEIAALRGWAAGEATAVKEAADAEVARAYAAAEDAIRQAQAQAARTSSIQPLSIPRPPPRHPPRQRKTSSTNSPRPMTIQRQQAN